jgi:hypothetical protein
MLSEHQNDFDLDIRFEFPPIAPDDYEYQAGSGSCLGRNSCASPCGPTCTACATVCDPTCPQTFCTCETSFITCLPSCGFTCAFC